MVPRTLLLVVSLALVFYGAVILWFRLNENSLIFSPEPGPISPPPAELNLGSRDVTLRGTDGARMRARLIPPPASVPAAEAAWLIYFHGSSGNIGLVAYNEAWAEFHRRGLGVFAIDYRGFGESEGVITEDGLYEDAKTAHSYVTGDLGIPPRRVLIYGFSMGAAVAIDLATRVDAAGLLVEGAWLSIPQLGAERYPFLPASLIAKNRFASVDKIAQVKMPKLFVHAEADAQIPLAHGRKLFELATEPKTFRALGGEHGTSHEVDPQFFTTVGDFVAARGLPLAPESNATPDSRAPSSR